MHLLLSLLTFTKPLQTPLLWLLCAKPKSSHSWVSSSYLLLCCTPMLAAGAPGRPNAETSFRLCTLPGTGGHQSCWARHRCHFPGSVLGSKLLFVIIRRIISNFKPLDFLQNPQAKLSHFSFKPSTVNRSKIDSFSCAL